MKHIILGALSLCFWFSLVFISPSYCGSPHYGSDNPQLGEIENRLSQDLSLPDLLNYAFLSNPSITASKESWQIFIENYRLGKSYPDPQLTTTYFPAPIETRLGPQDWNLTLSQALPFPGSLYRKGKVLDKDVSISKLKLDKTVKNIVAQVSGSFYELIYIQRAVEIARANLNLNQALLKISQNAYARDKALFYDVSKAMAQSAQIQYDILLFEELEQTEKTELNTLLNRPPNAGLGRAKDMIPRDMAYNLNEIYDLAMMNQEDILIADETVQKYDEAIRFSRFEILPSFKLGLFYAGIGQPDVTNPPRDAGDDAVGIQLGMSFPLWLGKNRSKASKALALREKAVADKAVIANRTKSQLSRLWFKLQNSKRLMSLYEKQLIPQALASVQTAETWFREGEGGFADFLEIQATAYNFQLSLARARTDYAQALVRLEEMVGVVLDSRPELEPEEISHEN